MNFARTALLMAALTGLFLAAGWLVGGESGAVMALMLAAGMNLFAYWNSDKMLLRMHGAQEVGPSEAPELHGLVRQLSARAGLPTPRVYVIDTPQPNAFATGRNPENAAVAVTTGLLRSLSSEELAGVLAHELAHVKNRDTLIMTITATIAGAIGMLANFAFFFGGHRDENGNGSPLGALGAVLVMLLAPLAAMLVQMAISRTREYAADRMGAEICGRPLWLASALARIEQLAQRMPNPAAERNPATAHLFIVNPLSGRSIGNLFATHPSTADRIAALHELAAAYGQAAPARRASPWGALN